MVVGFSERLGRRIKAGDAPAVVGLDPRLEALPEELRPTDEPADRIAAYYEAVLPLVARHVPVVKPNIAFFERFGAAGYAAYERTCAAARDVGLIVIGDIKRGDIGSTAAAYADEHFRHADAVTLHPYLGRDAIEPFLARCRDDGRGVFVLVRTSNPSAPEFQDLEVGGDRLCERVADAVAEWGAPVVDELGLSSVGAVVGATYVEEIAGFRSRMPRAWLLLPGVGAQGGEVSGLAPAAGPGGLGVLVSQSRGILQCFEPDDPGWRERIESALAAFAAELLAVFPVPRTEP